MHYPQWVVNFFQSSKISLKKISQKSYEFEQQKILESFFFPITQKQSYFVLPYINQDNQVRVYAAGAIDERALRDFESILKATLGTTYVEYYHVIKTGQQNDSVAHTLLEVFTVGVIRLDFYSMVKKNQLQQSFQLLNQMVTRLNSRPRMMEMAQRPVGRILRDFYLAQDEKNIELAESCLLEIKKNSSLGAKNIISLEIQALAIRQQSEEIIQHQGLQELIDGLLPPTLLKIILMALTECGGSVLLQPELPTDIDISLIQAKYQKFRPLFSRLPEISHSLNEKSQWYQWVVGAVLLGQYQHFECLPSFIDMKWCNQLINRLDHYDKVNIVAQDTQQLQITTPTSLEQVRVYLNYCTHQSPEYWQEIWNSLSCISLPLKATMAKNPSLKKQWDKIEAYCSHKVLYDWQNWFEQLLNDPKLEVESFLIKVQDEHSIWPASSFQEVQLLMVLDSLDLRSKDILRNALPILVEWLTQNKIKIELTTLLQLFSVMIDDEQHQPHDMLLAYKIVKYWLDLRVGTEFDQQMMLNLKLLWEKCGSKLNKSRASQVHDLLNTLNGFNKEDLLEFKQLINKVE